MLETKSAPFTFVKQGIYYFSRRVPSDLSHHYTADRICYSLRTKSAIVANSRAQRAAQQLDEHWYHLDLPLIFHPAATGARLVFTPNGAG
ncbi:hypothetical protein SAMN05444722_0512 [Rhodovulum sp. ES.010]|uniref:DUF6538 domain-containing protein n=1 Tax=Rhodovulum sp. ES.010 TaxID=1882821 RepID=UPI0009294320|nr:DUF6538 domain-containing protein [Rhodovulum sp. ES.010]SIO12352.1 hypothetical protein SAMN05444722_0512 [Rhodovulum sp. ES.010]